MCYGRVRSWNKGKKEEQKHKHLGLGGPRLRKQVLLQAVGLFLKIKTKACDRWMKKREWADGFPSTFKEFIPLQTATYTGRDGRVPWHVRTKVAPLLEPQRGAVNLDLADDPPDPFLRAVYWRQPLHSMLLTSHSHITFSR